MSKDCESDNVPEPNSSPYPNGHGLLSDPPGSTGGSPFRRHGVMEDRQLHRHNHIQPGQSYTPYQPPMGLPAGYSQPTPFPSQAEGSWLHPSFVSGWSGPGYPSSLPSCLAPGDYSSYQGESCYSRGKSQSLSGRYSPSMGSLEQPHSLHSNPPSVAMHHHSLPPYYCSPKGAPCCAPCPMEAFGPALHQSPRPGYHLPYGPFCEFYDLFCH